MCSNYSFLKNIISMTIFNKKNNDISELQYNLSTLIRKKFNIQVFKRKGIVVHIKSNRLKKILLLFSLFYINTSIYSQENIEKSQTDKIIKTAENYILKENYSSADSLLKNIILNSKLVPSENYILIW